MEFRKLVQLVEMMATSVGRKVREMNRLRRVTRLQLPPRYLELCPPGQSLIYMAEDSRSASSPPPFSPHLRLCASGGAVVQAVAVLNQKEEGRDVQSCNAELPTLSCLTSGKPPTPGAISLVPAPEDPDDGISLDVLQGAKGGCLQAGDSQGGTSTGDQDVSSQGKHPATATNYTAASQAGHRFVFPTCETMHARIKRLESSPTTLISRQTANLSACHF